VPHYDYIIAGAGAAGLSLIYHLGQTALRDRRILLIDPSTSRSNDRTWCFWETQPGPFEAVVARSWDHLWVADAYGPVRMPIAPYRYKLIQGIDFYRFVDEWIAARPNIERLTGTVEQFVEREHGVAALVNGELYEASYAFSSIYRAEPPPRGYHHWLQHFKGWVITTPQPAFDPSAATFMDFRVPQYGDVRFGYVLPYNERTALVEYTVFSAQLESQQHYEAGLRQYLHETLAIRDYTISHVEYGVIPMSDTPMTLRPSPHVLHIGTAAGMSKPSTGYTFQRIQRQSAQITAQLLHDGTPFYRADPLSRHALMDSVLLNVLAQGRIPGHEVFAFLLRRNPIQRVLRFLDEQSALYEDIGLMATVYWPAFSAAAVDVLLGRIRHRLGQRPAGR
jgi:lycopene beta-cyclase